MGEAKKKLEEKKRLFAENPDRFLDKEKLIIGAIRERKEDEEGYAFFINAAAPSLVLGALLFKLERQIHIFLDQREFKTQMEAQGKNRIITPQAGGNGELNHG